MASYYTIGWGVPGCLWDGNGFPVQGKHRAIMAWADSADLCAAHRREAMASLRDRGAWAAPDACSDALCLAPAYHYVEVAPLTRDEARELMEA